MNIPTLPLHLRERARKVSQHEMGHFVVARLLGFRTGDVSIELTGPVDGHLGGAAVILGEPVTTMQETACYLRRRIQILYAGALAETLPAQQVPERELDSERAIKILKTPGYGAEQDYAKVRELMQLLPNIEHPNTIIEDEVQQQLTALDLDLWNSTVILVQTYEKLIVGLAMNLAARVKGINQKATLEAAALDAIPSLRDLVPLFSRQA